jgi:hypothetical protein
MERDKQLEAIRIYVKLMDRNPVTEVSYRDFLPLDFSA